jgi:hypothetical protein
MVVCLCIQVKAQFNEGYEEGEQAVKEGGNSA